MTVETDKIRKSDRTSEASTFEPRTGESRNIGPGRTDPGFIEAETDEILLVEFVTIEPALVEPALAEATRSESTRTEPTIVEPTAVEPTPMAPRTPIPSAVRPEKANANQLIGESSYNKELASDWVDDRPRTTSEALGLPELTPNQHGHASLLDNPAPLSSLLHLPVLLRGDGS